MLICFVLFSSPVMKFPTLSCWICLCCCFSVAEHLIGLLNFHKLFFSFRVVTDIRMVPADCFRSATPLFTLSDQAVTIRSAKAMCNQIKICAAYFRASFRYALFISLGSEVSDICKILYGFAKACKQTTVNIFALRCNVNSVIAPEQLARPVVASNAA